MICTDVSIDPNDPNSPLTCVPEVLLDACTTYFWRVLSDNGCCPNTSGPVWSFTTSIPSDLNISGNVDMLDYSLFTPLYELGALCDSPDWCGGADINCNGTVGLDDMALLAIFWLDQCTSP